MLVGFGYNAFEQLISTEKRCISTPVPIFADQCSDGNFKVIIQWGSIHLLKDHQVICSSKSCLCSLLRSSKEVQKEKITDVDFRGNAAAVVVTKTGVLVVNKNGSIERVESSSDVTGCRFKTVRVGDTHIIATKADGSCGEVVYNEASYVYRPILLGRVCHVTCGKDHVLFLTESGEVYSYGIGSRGQLGHGQPDSEKSPRVVEALQGITVSAVSCGGWHSAALSGIGDVYIWGWNESGQIGFAMKPKPTFTSENEKFNTEKDSYQNQPYFDQKAEEEFSSESREIDMKFKCKEPEREMHAIDLNRIKSSYELPLPLKTERADDNEASCCEDGADVSTCKDITIQFSMLPSLLDFPDDFSVSKISCGSRHTAAVLENGKLYTWGWGKYGQLGHGDTKTIDRPTLVTALEDKQVVDVVCGEWNTVVVCESLPPPSQSLLEEPALYHSAMTEPYH
ncbi:RCC1 domain-containing protein 1-like [Anneissia japonica]|uniref:RCC1 domain-containing protein 1-like n=1 Tax=Anneissia japonica TaxID=1529436 RepID=UPI0014258575|nr:RCC1 domain-containing protein 1-like [Anneissia japonica]